MTTVLNLIGAPYVHLLASIGVGLFFVALYVRAMFSGSVIPGVAVFPNLFLASQGIVSGLAVLLKVIIVVIGVQLRFVDPRIAYGFFGLLDYGYMVVGAFCALGISAVGIWDAFFN